MGRIPRFEDDHRIADLGFDIIFRLRCIACFQDFVTDWTNMQCSQAL